MAAWTPVPKPTEASVLLGGDAQPFGLLIAITSITSGPSTSITTGWGDVSKPTIASWTGVPKPASTLWTIVPKPSS